MDGKKEALLKRGRTMYVFEALVEYLISLLMTGSFLATVTKSLDFSDSLTGIISSVIALGCTFQLLSVLLKDNAQRARAIMANYKPEFSSMQEYFAFVDKLNVDDDVVAYEGEDKVILKY